MLVLVFPPVSSRVSGFPVASPCLWGKLQNLSFCHVATCENWRKSRTKCFFFCIHVFCRESLVFLWRRRVYGEAGKPVPFECFHAGCPVVLRGRRGSFWHSNLFDNVWKMSKLEEVSYEMLFPECVARVPVSLWGSGGWGCVRSTLRLWSQPSATVRNRSYELRMAVPMGSSAEVVIFGSFQCIVASFRVQAWHFVTFRRVL